MALFIRIYLAGTARTLASDGPIFRAHDFYAANRPRQRLTTRALEHVVGRTARRAGVVAKRVTPHSLRHTFAIRALRHGADVTALAKLLGHANVATTMRYVDHLETAEFAGEGLVIETERGRPIQNPKLVVANRASELLLKAAVEFGMSPSARPRVAAALPAEPDPFDDFLKGHGRVG